MDGMNGEFDEVTFAQRAYENMPFLIYYNKYNYISMFYGNFGTNRDSTIVFSFDSAQIWFLAQDCRLYDEILSSERITHVQRIFELCRWKILPLVIVTNNLASTAQYLRLLVAITQTGNTELMWNSALNCGESSRKRKQFSSCQTSSSGIRTYARQCQQIGYILSRSSQSSNCLHEDIVQYISLK